MKSGKYPVLYENKADCCGCTACFAVCPADEIVPRLQSLFPCVCAEVPQRRLLFLRFHRHRPFLPALADNGQFAVPQGVSQMFRTHLGAFLDPQAEQGAEAHGDPRVGSPHSLGGACRCPDFHRQPRPVVCPCCPLSECQRPVVRQPVLPA